MRHLIIATLLLISCGSKTNSTEDKNQVAAAAVEQNEMDTFVYDTIVQVENDSISEAEKVHLLKTVLKTLKPKNKIKTLKIEQILDVYNTLLETTKKYKDSSQSKRTYLNEVYEALEVQNKHLEEDTKYPVELKLKVASIKSDIHFLRSNAELKTK